MTTTTNAQLVERGFDHLFSGDIDAVVALLRDDFVHHQPDRAAMNKIDFIAALQTLPATEMKNQVLHLSADEDYVTVLSQRWYPGQQHGTAAVDIWRLEDGLIVEHFDVLQQVAPQADPLPTI